MYPIEPKKHQSLPPSGSIEVAYASFGTAFGVSILVVIAGVYARLDWILLSICCVCMIGSGTGFVLWLKGHRRTACFLGASGLLSAGAVSHILLGTVGSAAGILYLASVITAGGLAGRRAAILDILACLTSIGLIHAFGDEMRQAADLPLAGFQVSEWAYLTFVASSVPCWGLYVLALDNSNRRARAQSEESLRLLEAAHARQIAVAELGLLGSSDCTLDELNEACLHLLRKHIPEASVTVDADGLQIDSSLQAQDKSFLQALQQILEARMLREKVLEERAKLAAKLQREVRLEALERMAGGVAHDFNNTLAVIVGVAENLKETTPKEVSEPLNLILSASEVAAGLTQKLLTFSSGIPLAPVLIDPAEVIEKIEPMLRETLQDGSHLHSEIHTSSAKLHLPAIHLEQALLNLVRNSAQAIEHKGDIHILLEQDAQDWVQIVVKDNGEGMDSSTVERAIEPFFTGRGPNQKGSGLGLAIVHGIMEQAAGTLHILSTPGEGTKVRLSFPPAPSENEAHPNHPINSKKGTPSRVGRDTKRVLLAEDETAVREVLSEMLRRMGWTVDAASCIEEALTLFQANPSELIISDIRLGEESGHDLIQTIRDHGDAPKVLFITGYSGQDRARTTSGEHLLVKPFTKEELQHAIEVTLTT